MKFRVEREHIGDRSYKVGDIREANESTVAHLVKGGVLSKTGGKAEPSAPKNKALKSAPKNKADTDLKAGEGAGNEATGEGGDQ
ncbi:hypothetical protein A7A08_01703 [Methyloligella halotolerans]|uniref:Uncharacterized protein n=1 Tax=Methyloligella halotolerans TaxID=1177755 RepID=A0A1E2S002_9HYPH|nr:hypothetical protein [Methyloligella halotolerans]ODA67668.1 hypothetical protein A7A08_01703 [Methyloligella halotolerans]